MATNRTLLTVALSLAFTMNATAAQRADAQAAADPARDAVLATVQRMFDSMRAKDTAALVRLFDPGARLVGMRTRKDGTAVVQSIPIADFAVLIARDPRPEWIERAWNPQVQIRGTLATVWAEYDFHFGSTPWSCGIDAVQLLRVGDQWKIMSIADTYEQTGCPVRPAPVAR